MGGHAQYVQKPDEGPSYTSLLNNATSLSNEL